MAVLRLNDIKQNKTRGEEAKRGPILRLRDLHKIKRWEGFEINKHWEQIEDIGRLTRTLQIRQGPFDGVVNGWKNQPAYVVGGSIAGRGLDLNLLRGRHTIGVNHMIEYYDGFEWFLFQDHRFLRKTTYDLKKYKGKIFCHNSNPIDYGEVKDLVFFKSRRRKPVDLKIEDGLWHRSLSGICATHLALISGANPIYLIGLDTAKDIDIETIEKTGLHYDKNYTGETKLKLCYKNVTDKLKLFRDFYPWKDRIINVCENGEMDWFKQISLKGFTERLK
jgi:hypothetical protein